MFESTPPNGQRTKFTSVVIRHKSVRQLNTNFVGEIHTKDGRTSLKYRVQAAILTTP